MVIIYIKKIITAVITILFSEIVHYSKKEYNTVLSVYIHLFFILHDQIGVLEVCIKKKQQLKPF